MLNRTFVFTVNFHCTLHHSSKPQSFAKVSFGDAPRPSTNLEYPPTLLRLFKQAS